MSSQPHIRGIAFVRSAHAELVAGLDCGDTRWGNLATEWIQGPRAVRSQALGTQVLLYLDHADLLVGFGSIGPNKWTIEGEPVELRYIPMIGLASSHQGKPEHVAFSEKFSGLIVADLITRAVQFGHRLLGLLCHPDNTAAMKLYVRFGFEQLPTSDGFGNRHMVLRLS